MVQLDGVGLGYGTTTVLHGLSFAIAEGGFRWLVGPSGAGKTSLLRLLHLAVRPTTGRLELMGQDIGAARRTRLPLLTAGIAVSAARHSSTPAAASSALRVSPSARAASRQAASPRSRSRAHQRTAASA